MHWRHCHQQPSASHFSTASESSLIPRSPRSALQVIRPRSPLVLNSVSATMMANTLLDNGNSNSFSQNPQTEKIFIAGRTVSVSAVGTLSSVGIQSSMLPTEPSSSSVVPDRASLETPSSPKTDNCSVESTLSTSIRPLAALKIPSSAATESVSLLLISHEFVLTRLCAVQNHAPL